jgi:hypothetical protein
MFKIFVHTKINANRGNLGADFNANRGKNDFSKTPSVKFRFNAVNRGFNHFQYKYHRSIRNLISFQMSYSLLDEISRKEFFSSVLPFAQH